ncbi:MAG TPA: SDR family oxidoreductase [Acidimicrobiales bacterium]
MTLTMDLSGRRVLVVGASSGIGRAIAARLWHLGASVAAAARREDLLHSLVDDLAAAIGGDEDRSQRAVAVPVDVTDPVSVEHALATTENVFGGLDAMVYASGVTPLVGIGDATAEDWQHALGTNLIGAGLVTRATLSRLSELGICLYLSSDVTSLPRDGMSTYAASKGGLDAAIATWRQEHPLVRFTRVIVGPTWGTEAGSDMPEDLAAEMFPRWVARGGLPQTPMAVTDLGPMLADHLAVQLAYPGISVWDLRAEPPGPIADNAGNVY